jgi:hypothetical protein
MMKSQSIIDSSSVTSTAFVFHATDFEQNWVNCTGMRLVFFTRYYVDDHCNLVAFDPQLHLPFGSSGESYTSRLWFSLVHVKDNMSQLMNQRTQ